MHRTLAILLFSAGCLGGQLAAEEADHVSDIGEIRLLHGWTTATTGDVAGVYFELEHNGTTPAELRGGSSELAKHVHIAAAPIKAGGMPEEIDVFPLAPGIEFDFGPQSVFLLLEELTAPLEEGEHFEVMVDIHPFGMAELEVEIYEAGTTQHSHAGHNH